MNSCEKIIKVIKAETEQETREAIALFTRKQKEILRELLIDYLRRETEDQINKQCNRILDMICDYTCPLDTYVIMGL